MTVSGSARTYTYDSLGRLSQRVSGLNDGSVLTETFTYTAPSATSASGQVATMRLQGAGLDVTYSYTYDDNGNILTVSDGTNTTSYTYDKANQLIREDNQAGGFTHVWSYDTAGNILSRTEYGYTTGELGTPTDTVGYTYGDEDWGDLLTAYDGVNISYDGIGNPLSDGTWSYTWEHGRELAAMTDGTATWSFAYDVNGLRTSRTNGSTAYNYIYNGSSLSKLTVGNNTLYFTYGAEGQPLTLTHNGANYFYATNLQGDVVAILNSSGNPVVRYTYDAWGSPLTVTDTSGVSLATLNPLRYRGYVFDPETGLYYLQSRYYDPSLGRFINADDISCLGADGSILSYNLFAYCINNPVNRFDGNGNWSLPSWLTTVVAVAAATVAIVATVATLGAAAPAAACTLTLMATSVGVSYATASAVATVAVTTTVGAAALYAGDAAYSAVSGRSPLKQTLFDGNEEAYNTGRALVTVATLGMAAAATNSPGVCFVAGTPVLAECGYKVIEEINAGDLVWAENPETGEKELKEVVQTFVNETTELFYVQVDGEEIVTTPEHPFYSPVKGWTEACKLRAGDILVTVNGEYVVVERIQHEILESPITVYNFEVEDFHTYYVSNIGALVHNSCNHNSAWDGERRSYWKETAKTAEQDAYYGAYIATKENIKRMSQGLAPTGWDGYSVHLHHWNGIANDFYNYSPVSRTLHQLIHAAQK